ncbi:MULTISPECIES: acyltransferase [Metabacillus]|uniref:acyltransferase n=1 Tax=Metabacillus TaxID=2675233 RepID=UPI000EF60A38|nr:MULTISPECIES: acyltransferase family protein [Metabacillus]UGB30474.1 acyltransferase family protein [Metabacillus sp. B2-18]UHA61539.1 acyltransferase family protein [Metabacillus litoralis]
MTKSRIFYFDNLRIVATFAVVLLHAAAPILYKFQTVTSTTWWTGNIYDSLTRWCVPIFFMLSGALLLNPDRTDKPMIFIRKRISKVIIPLLGWSTFYLIVQINREVIINDPFMITKAFFENDVYYHLWFLYVIIAIYLILPVLKVYIAGASQKNLQYYLLLCFIVTSVFSYISKFHEITVDIKVEAATGYIGYFLLGYYLHRYGLSKITKIVMYLLAIVASIVIIRGTYDLTVQNEGFFDGFFYHYLNMPVVFLSIAVFIFFQDFKFDLSRFFLFSIINKTSLGIYLLHPYIFLLLLENYDIHAHTVRAWAGIPILATFTLLVSMIVVMILQKIPVVKRFVP